VSLVARTGETPSNRTLVNKAVAVGLLEAAQTALPVDPTRVTLIPDTAEAVDTAARVVRLSSGAVLGYDALIVATGSTPRPLDRTIPGADEAEAAGLLTTLHSIEDAERVRALLTTGSGAQQNRRARIAVLGGGLIAAETASVLRDGAHDVTIINRSAHPGVGAFGAELGARLEELHRAHVSTAFGRRPTAFHLTDRSAEGRPQKRLEIDLDDASHVHVDFAILAQGTVPTGPQPWSQGIDVDEDLGAARQSVYGAGGVALHHDSVVGTWRIDHWSDAAAQGEHAARAALHDLGAAASPGRYVPRSLFTAAVYGATVAAAGLIGEGLPARVLSTDPLVTLHERDNIAVGAAGLNALPTVLSLARRLQASQAD
jgi:3-phenylpropionate/trans-cinnamate dioxygenase ferredoxin reductase subunit